MRRLPRLPSLSLGQKNARLQSLLQAGDAARDRRDWAVAAGFYEKIVAAKPSAYQIVVQLGHAYKEMGDLRRASEQYYKALATHPGDDDLQLQIGHLEKQRGDTAKALSFYQQALALNPANSDARREYEALTRAGSLPGGQPATARADVEGSSRHDVPASPRFEALAKLSAAELRRLGDRARDTREWPAAAAAYQAYLERVPTDWAIWIQSGHALKESGDVAGGEAAYRRAVAGLPTDPDAPLQLGHALKLRGKEREAIEAYRQSFALRPLRAVAAELQQLGTSVADEIDKLPPPTRLPGIFLEISDLFSDLLDSQTISGIQRVQLGIIAHILDEHGRGETLDCCFAVWDSDALWRFPDEALHVFLGIYETSDQLDLKHRRRLVEDALNRAELIRPMPGDVVMTTGVIYRRPNIAKSDFRLKRGGARLGAYIYDFIPLTHPEHCDRRLTNDFSPTIADALLQYDFVLTISEHVASETRRLLAAAGYPPIPVRAVPLAHSLLSRPAMSEDNWTPAIMALQDREFALCVATISGQKNQRLLFQIWQILIAEDIEPPQLVLVGRRGHNIGDLMSQLATSRNLGGRVHVIEGLSDSELATLYRNCLFTLFPSFVEGWGLPVGESLAYGKPCIASNAASLPEVGGDFVLYIDPYNARAGADLVRHLLADRGELERLQTRIGNDFRPHTWHQHGSAFLSAIRELSSVTSGRRSRPRPLAMPVGSVLRPFWVEEDWRYGTALPPWVTVARKALRSVVLEEGWYPAESWGSWMRGTRARIGLTIDREPSDRVRVLLQFQAAPWAHVNALTIRAGCGATTSVPVPESARTAEVYPVFHAWLDCAPDEAGRIDLGLEVSGEIAEPWWEEARRFCIGVLRILCLPSAGFDAPLPADRLIRPTAQAGARGRALVPSGTAALSAALRRRAVLVEGWCEPEAWGAWMSAATARIAFCTGNAGGQKLRVGLRLRRGVDHEVRLQVASGCGTVVSLDISEDEPNDFPVWIDCESGTGGIVELTLTIVGRAATPAADLRAQQLGITGLVYGSAETVAAQLTLNETLWAREGREERAREFAELSADLRFSVVGHMNGSYSLAAVNRRLALALDKAVPGRVRVEQIETRPTEDLSLVPAVERTAITALMARERHEEGPVVEITRHWPLWVPQQGADLKLAYVPWEESLVPLAMVRTLNEHFHAVLAETRFVAKVLVDSGVRLPVRVMGCAPDLAPFIAAAERHATGDRKPANRVRPFTFLHVSSCFPRKGVDALLAAYVQTFRKRDPVRLLIKGFPNPHNDVAAQIAELQRGDSDAPAIEFINRDLPPAALAELYAGADAFVLPTRGDGFAVPAAEALAARLPLIVTGYGGHIDFASPAVARHVAWRFAPSRSHVRSAGSVWVEPDIGDLAAAMHEIYQAHAGHTADPVVAARVKHGQAVAAALADDVAWATRVRRIAVELLSQGPRRKSIAPTVAWVTTWNVRCGIATYSKFLLSRYPDAARDVTILCDERTPSGELRTAGAPAARVAWRIGDPEAADRLVRQIAGTGAPSIVVQHQQGLMKWPVLAQLLTDERLADRQLIVVLHSLLDLKTEAYLAEIVTALRRASRVLVHSVRDLNLLRSWGIIDNATLFTHGAARPTTERMPIRDLPITAAPLLGAYGFFLPHKGFDVLIEALAEVRRTWPGARLRLVTAEYPAAEAIEELARCHALAQSLGLRDAIEWRTDFLPDQESLQLLSACDLVILPYRETPEAASGAVRIAMASRAPVLVTPVAVFDELGPAALRAGDLDAGAIAIAVSDALRDRKRREQTAAEAEKWLDERDWSRASERLYGMICGLAVNEEASSLPDEADAAYHSTEQLRSQATASSQSLRRELPEQVQAG